MLIGWAGDQRVKIVVDDRGPSIIVITVGDVGGMQ